MSEELIGTVDVQDGLGPWRVVVERWDDVPVISIERTSEEGIDGCSPDGARRLAEVLLHAADRAKAIASEPVAERSTVRRTAHYPVVGVVFSVDDP